VSTPRAPAPVGTLPIVEAFLDTIQGEGPAAGRAASFIRFAGCNLSCSWCDSAYTWDAARYDLRAMTQHRTPAELVAAINRGPGLVILTGGEPLLQQRQPGWVELLDRLNARPGGQIHIETNGTVEPTVETLAKARQIIVSPKLGNAGEHRGHQSARLHPTYRRLASGGAEQIHLKVVCENTADVLAAKQLADEYGFPPEQVWVMPQGTTVAQLQQRWPDIAAAAANFGINACHRLHVLAWGDERGR
jgi:7-carboxy-7-deazaguanine synthase